MSMVNFDVAAFTGRFKDFIEDNRQVGGAFTPANPAIFQSSNVGRVRISGFEVKGQADWGRVGPGTLTMPFAYGRAKGHDSNTGRPLNSVNPERVNLGLQYEAGKWLARIDATYRAAKKADDVDKTALATQFVTPAATTLDISAQWRITKDLRLTAGIYNLTDKKYWNWADVNAVSSAQSTVDAWTQPGRYARVTLVADF
jgi:hemoglobin/transferrin/lactoferrin receptor protein